MSFAAFVDPVLLDTVMGQLAVFFLSAANNDTAAARRAAESLVACYKPATEEEFTLTGRIISFNLNAMESLSEAANPELAFTRILRLRGNAVSLNREAHRTQRKLDQLQQDRKAAAEDAPKATASAQPSAQTTENQPAIDDANALIDMIQEAVGIVGKAKGQTWTQGLNQRMKAKRQAEKLLKQQRKQASQKAAPAPEVETEPQKAA